jgi:hypothetical protein
MRRKTGMAVLVMQGITIVVLIAVIVVNWEREADLDRRIQSLERSRENLRKIKELQDMVNHILLNAVEKKL